MWFDGEPNGRSDIGDDDNDEDREEGRDDSDEFVGVGGIEVGVMVSDRSRALEINCPLCGGCISQCFKLEGASLSF